MRNSESAQRLNWPELKFPPINLWVMAQLDVQQPSEGETAHRHRRQRPGLLPAGRQPNALQNLHRQLAELLAERGGKYGN